MKILNKELIDPFRIYVVKDLFNLYKGTKSVNWFSKTFRDLTKSVMTLDDLQIYMNKPLHLCTRNELKFILVLVGDRLKVDQLLTKDGEVTFHIHELIEVNTVIQCFLNSLEPEILKKARPTLCYSESKIQLKYIISNGSIEVMNEVNLPELSDVFVSRISIHNKDTFNLGHSYFRRSSPTHHEIASPGRIFTSRMNIMRRPFRESSNYPKLNPDSAKIRMRDLIFPDDTLTSTTWFKRPDVYLKNNIHINEVSLIQMFMSDIDNMTNSKLLRLEKILHLNNNWDKGLYNFRRNIRLPKYKKLNEIYNEIP